MGGLNKTSLRYALCPLGCASFLASLHRIEDREFSEVNVDTIQMVHEWCTRHLCHF